MWVLLTYPLSSFRELFWNTSLSLTRKLSMINFKEVTFICFRDSAQLKPGTTCCMAAFAANILVLDMFHATTLWRSSSVNDKSVLPSVLSGYHFWLVNACWFGFTLEIDVWSFKYMYLPYFDNTMTKNRFLTSKRLVHYSHATLPHWYTNVRFLAPWWHESKSIFMSSYRTSFDLQLSSNSCANF